MPAKKDVSKDVSDEDIEPAFKDDPIKKTERTVAVVTVTTGLITAGSAVLVNIRDIIDATEVEDVTIIDEAGLIPSEISNFFPWLILIIGAILVTIGVMWYWRRSKKSISGKQEKTIAWMIIGLVSGLVIFMLVITILNNPNDIVLWLLIIGTSICFIGVIYFFKKARGKEVGSWKGKASFTKLKF